MTNMDQDLFDPTRRYPPNKVLSMISGSASFLLLEYALTPTYGSHLPMQDVVLVSIDLESRLIEGLGKRITQVGVASLDTRILSDIDVEDSQSLLDAVQSRNFSIYPKRASPRGWSPKSLWTAPEKIEHYEICDKLREIFYPQEKRDILLIGHGIRADRRLLIELFAFDLKQVKTVTAILDTGRMICNAYDFGINSQSHFPLRFMLRSLGVRYEQLHDAGNDAMFAMKALLLMFCNWKHQKGRHLWNIAESVILDEAVLTDVTETLLWDQRLDTLTAIARTALPRPRQMPPRRPRSYKSRPPRDPEPDCLESVEDLNLDQLFQ